MTTSAPTPEKRTDTHADLDERDIRALTEYLTGQTIGLLRHDPRRDFCSSGEVIVRAHAGCSYGMRE